MILLVHFSVVHRLGADKKVGAEETTTTSRDSRDEVRGVYSKLIYEETLPFLLGKNNKNER